LNLYDYLNNKGKNKNRSIEHRTTILKTIPTNNTISSLEVSEITGLPYKTVAAILGNLHVKTRALRRNHNNGDGVLWSIREESVDEVKTAIKDMER